MAEQDQISITVLIANRPYPLRINATDEPTIRKIVKEVNDLINKLQVTYSNKDKQDCMAMALLTYAVDLQQAKSSSASHSEFSEQIERIEQLLGGI